MQLLLVIQAAEGSLAWTYVCDRETSMASAVIRVRQAAVRTAKALAGEKCISRTPENTKARGTCSSGTPGQQFSEPRRRRKHHTAACLFRAPTAVIMRVQAIAAVNPTGPWHLR